MLVFASLGPVTARICCHYIEIHHLPYFTIYQTDSELMSPTRMSNPGAEADLEMQLNPFRWELEIADPTLSDRTSLERGRRTERGALDVLLPGPAKPREPEACEPEPERKAAVRGGGQRDEDHLGERKEGPQGSHGQVRWFLEDQRKAVAVSGSSPSAAASSRQQVVSKKKEMDIIIVIQIILLCFHYVSFSVCMLSMPSVARSVTTLSSHELCAALLTYFPLF